MRLKIYTIFLIVFLLTMSLPLVIAVPLYDSLDSIYPTYTDQASSQDGMCITPHYDVNITQVTLVNTTPNPQYSRIYLQANDLNGPILANATVSGTVATFDTPVQLLQGQRYLLYGWNGPGLIYDVGYRAVSVIGDSILDKINVNFSCTIDSGTIYQEGEYPYYPTLYVYTIEGVTTELSDVPSPCEVGDVFCDDSETGAPLDKWSLYGFGGVVNYTEDKSYSGFRSIVNLDAFATSIISYGGTVNFPYNQSVMFYDDGSSVSGYELFEIGGDASGACEGIGIGLHNWFQNDYSLIATDPSCSGYNTGITRSVGWHELKFIAYNESFAEAYIDRTLVYNGTSPANFGNYKIKITDYLNPPTRGWDDARIVAVSNSSPSPCDIYTGSGTEVDPYQIIDNAGFENIYLCNLSSNYKLMNDLVGTSYSNNGAVPFSGVFDGDGHTIYNQTAVLFLGDVAGTIKNLKVDWPDVNEISVLVENTISGTIENVTITSVSASSASSSLARVCGGIIKNLTVYTTMLSGGNVCGGVCAENQDVIIDGLYGSVNISNCGASGMVGGVIGNSDAGGATEIKNVDLDVYFNLPYSGAGGPIVGGLIGNFVNDGYITNANVNINSFSNESGSSGGLIGSAQGSVYYIESSSVTGSLSASGSQVGGIVGNADNNAIFSINNSNAIVSVISDNQVGGLIGVAGAYIAFIEIKNSYAIASVISNSGNAGGLVGGQYFGSILINNSYFEGNVTGNGNYVGGLMGNSGDPSSGHFEIYNSHVVGEINNIYENAGEIGGLIGMYYEGIIDNSSFIGDIHCEVCSQDVGGLAGGAYGPVFVSNSYVLGNVYGRDFLGGLLGGLYGGGLVNNSYFIGNVVATGNSYIGGIASYVDGGSIIENSYVIGNITFGGPNVGGIAGYLDQSVIIDSYANVNVDGTYNVGGLVGDSLTSDITRSYSIGTVHGSNSVGGIAGQTSESVISESYSTADVSAGKIYYISPDTSPNGSMVIDNICYAGGTECGATFYWQCCDYLYTNGFETQAYDATSCGACGTGTSTGNDVGGLEGLKSGGIIDNCYAAGDVSGAADGLGGLVGGMNQGVAAPIITDSYATGSIMGTALYNNIQGGIGGLIGYANAGDISSSYSIGFISSEAVTSSTGGLVGTGGTITDSYWDTETSGQDCNGLNMCYVGGLPSEPWCGANSNYYVAQGVDCTVKGDDCYNYFGGSFGLVGDPSCVDFIKGAFGPSVVYPEMGRALTTQEMKIQSNLAGFDYENTWGQDDTYEYPQLGPKSLKLLSYSCANVTPQEGSAVAAELTVETNDGSKQVSLDNYQGTCIGDNCNVSMQYYYSPGDYDLTVTMINGSETLHRVIPSCVSYGELQATAREGDSIQFSGVTYGIQNKTSDAPLVFENTGNAEITTAYLTAYDLVSAVPGYTLSVSNFRAGLTLNNSVQLTHATPVSIPFELVPGDNSKVNFYVWSSIPSNQYPTQYVSTTVWGLTLE